MALRYTLVLVGAICDWYASLDHVSTRRYYTFHDRDVAPEGETLEETNKNLDQVGCIVHLASCILHLRNLYGALFKLPVARSMLPVAWCGLHLACSPSSVVGCILQISPSALHAACCMLHVSLSIRPDVPSML